MCALIRKTAKEVLAKLYTVGYDAQDNVMFGTDCTAGVYSHTWAIGTERASAAPIRYAKAHYEGNFEELPVLDEAYALYLKDDITLSGEKKTDLLANLLGACRREESYEE